MGQYQPLSLSPGERLDPARSSHSEVASLGQDWPPTRVAIFPKTWRRNVREVCVELATGHEIAPGRSAS